MKKILASLLIIAVVAFGAVQVVPVLRHVSNPVVIADDPVPPPEPPPNNNSSPTTILATGDLHLRV